MATEKERFAELMNTRDFDMITSFKQTYIDALKLYYFVGGMPEAVQCFAENKDFNEVRAIQRRILEAYEQDFSKHAPWCGILFRCSWQKKIKNSFTVLYVKVGVQKIMKLQLCG